MVKTIGKLEIVVDPRYFDITRKEKSFGKVTKVQIIHFHTDEIFDLVYAASEIQRELIRAGKGKSNG